MATYRSLFSTFLFILFSCFIMSGYGEAVHAAELESDEVQVTTPVYFPVGDYEFREGTFQYEVSWQGIPAALAQITTKKSGDRYEVYMSARTNKVVDIFYRLRYAALGSLSALDFSPGYLQIDQRENQKVTKAIIRFSETGRIQSELTKTGKDPKEYDFTSENFTMEPLSAAFLARSLAWKPGDVREFDTFDGKTRYLITLKCVDLISVKVNNEKRRVWVVEPKVVNLNKNEKSKKLRKAHIYVTADKYRDLLQLQSEVFVGSVTTKLKSFKPLPREAVSLAQNVNFGES
ncbi:MAG: DUF3108 domain-containing protein [Bdellovibrionales bacterium]|nr:DUF3108 domain-containing protein [Bdellovibrionales bacterium]